MPNHYRLACAAWFACAIASCTGDGGSKSFDAIVANDGAAPDSSWSAHDASPSPVSDGGLKARDAGQGRKDSGASGLPDAATAHDAGPSTTDAAVPATDAQASSPDAARPEHDAATTCSGPNCVTANQDLNLCGNGKVDARELCDPKVSVNLPGVCPSLCAPHDRCLSSPRWGGVCDTVCEWFIEPESRCCMEASSTVDLTAVGYNPDYSCAHTYPFDRSFKLTGADRSADKFTDIAFPPPKCGPAVVSMSIAGTGFPWYYDAYLRSSFWFAGPGTGKLVQFGLGMQDPPQHALLLDVHNPNAMMRSLRYEISHCTNPPCSDSQVYGANPAATLTIHASEFLADTVVDQVKAETPRIASSGADALIAYRDVSQENGQIWLVGGHLPPGTSIKFLGEPQWKAAFDAHGISDPNVDAREPVLEFVASEGPLKAAHVAWIEDGTKLRHVVTSAQGVVVKSQVLAQGAPLTQLHMMRTYDGALVVAYRREDAGTHSVWSMRLSAAGDVLIGPKVLALANADITEFDMGLIPSKSGSIPSDVQGRFAWIDAANATVLHVQAFASDDLSLQATPATVAAQGDEPRDPIVRAFTSANDYSLFWTARVAGIRQAFTVNRQLSHAPLDISALHAPFRPLGLGVPAPGLPLLWSQGTSGDRLRYRSVLGEASGVRLGCDAEPAGDADIATAGTYNIQAQQVGGPLNRWPIPHAVWVQGKRLVVKQLSTLTATPDQPYCQPLQPFCADDRQIKLCGSDAITATLVERCDFPLACDPKTVSCRCKPGPACAGNRATVCTAEGLFADGGEDCSASAATCVHGQCQAPMLYESFEGSLSPAWLISGTTSISDQDAAPGGGTMSLRTTSTVAYETDGLKPHELSIWVRYIVAARLDFADILGRFIVTFAGNKVTPTCPNCANIVTNVDGHAWHHIEFRNIDWQAHTLDYYLDGMLIKAGVSIAGMTQLRRIELGGNPESIRYWDELTLR